MTTRRAEYRKRFMAWIAVGCSVAFVGASNYCNLEAVAAHPAGHQHDEESSTPAHHHEEGAGVCCSAMQAITTSKFDCHLASSPAWQLPPLALQSVWLVSFLEPSRTTSGLSPPAREPTPARPFYRTAFASHAPPVCLA